MKSKARCTSTSEVVVANYSFSISPSPSNCDSETRQVSNDTKNGRRRILPTKPSNSDMKTRETATRPSFNFPSARMKCQNPWDECGPAFDFELECSGNGYGVSSDNSRKESNGSLPDTSGSVSTHIPSSSEEWESRHWSGENHRQELFHNKQSYEVQCDGFKTSSSDAKESYYSDRRCLIRCSSSSSEESSFSPSLRSSFDGTANASLDSPMETMSESEDSSYSSSSSLFFSSGRESKSNKTKKHVIAGTNASDCFSAGALFSNHVNMNDVGIMEQRGSNGEAIPLATLSNVHGSKTSRECGYQRTGQQGSEQIVLSYSQTATRSLPKGGCQRSKVVLAAKKEPAYREGKEQIRLLTNFWELKVNNKIVYRYDVSIYFGYSTNERAINILRGFRDDGALVARRKLCTDAVHYAFEHFQILHDGSAVAYDGSAMLFASENLNEALEKGMHYEQWALITLDEPELPFDSAGIFECYLVKLALLYQMILYSLFNVLPVASSRMLLIRCSLFVGEDDLCKYSITNGILSVKVEELNYKFYDFFKEEVKRNLNAITIEIVPCRDAASSFDMADLSAQSNRDWATIDRSWKQFYELVTSQDAILSGKFTLFGTRSLFYCQSPLEQIGYGYETFRGAHKGIKFIEGSRPDVTDVVAALVLDYRVGVFYKAQNVRASVREIEFLRDVEIFDFSRDTNGRMNAKWSELDFYLKGVRMNYFGYGKDISFVASGISKEPIRHLKETLSEDEKTLVPLMYKFVHTNVSINPDWPAISEHQRVGREKLLLQKTASSEIIRALNLHDSGSKNRFLLAFGISVASKPKELLGIRRQPPSLFFANRRDCAINLTKHNWRLQSQKFIRGGSVDCIIIVHSDPTRRLPRIVRDVLSTSFEQRGIICQRFEAELLSYSSSQEKEQSLEEIFKRNRSSEESLLFVLIDQLENKSHGFLKLMERKYLIATQQITSELVERLPRQSQSCLYFISKMNLKLGGFNYAIVPESFARNRWIASGDTLVLGYDVSHPVKQSKEEILSRSPPQKPSVVGFSFNGATDPECFIGDYHFQTPRKERVESTVLNARMKWMLSLYCQHRGRWPSKIVITRDGVSEGQYRMVVEEELSAIKEACEEFGLLHGDNSWMPLFTVIIATKRHHARFFVQSGHGAENPKPGTVVDTEVVRNDITEFYMQSSQPLKGTAKPTSYQVLVDENDMGSDELQSLLLALTFHHQICDSPVSLPEPVYQADEWAKRGKDIWKAYTDRHNPILAKEYGAYSAYPIDFEAMTKRLAFWNTRLEARRVNA
ncbi:unnamed protein product [Cylicocyclus nassatus]|uniref:Piwi domain-containing protein n=1 Tax=Cylicocyclus nassatus TaxID=53992 RepID=A0AA36GI64_CYLNA|nr:unnamed protein product [Cylicocyclus nassatus]